MTRFWRPVGGQITANRFHCTVHWHCSKLLLPPLVLACERRRISGSSFPPEIRLRQRLLLIVADLTSTSDKVLGLEMSADLIQIVS